MSSLSYLLILATLLAGAFAQGENSTTSEEVTTTEVPTQAPEEKLANYSVSTNDKVCLRLVGYLTMEIAYNNATETVPAVEVSLFDPSLFDTDISKCEDKDATLGLTFDAFGQDTPQSITFNFKKDSSNDKVWNSMDIVYFFDTNTFPPDLNMTQGNYNLTAGKLFNNSLDVGSSYSCTNNPIFVFNSSSVDGLVTATLNVTKLQVQAFIESDQNLKEGFGSAQDCAASKGNKIVPIAVGAALAGLVIVVLIAYLIGRLKSRRQNSYEALS